MAIDHPSRRTFLAAAAATGVVTATGSAFSPSSRPTTIPAVAPERVSYEWWENVGYRFWEVARSSAFVPCAVISSSNTRGPTVMQAAYPWHNVLLGKEFDRPAHDPSAYLLPQIERAIIPPVYTRQRPDSDLLDIGYSTNGWFFAWMGGQVDPAALTPEAKARLKDTVAEWAEGRSVTITSPRIFGIPTPPNEVEFWLSLHTPERTRQFQQHWKENPHDRPSIGPQISIQPTNGPRFFEPEAPED